ncbi:hypothetical protein F511_26710 [Dorcoceras hygrometricum]|uniref:Myb-like domain-containing protein n=1 Tax=Dorcoceras hygrometricum TaxID=472368 RepID=A0A2Z7CM58_9LAMI|nr:hypothetical protein F511_26710 [Dorcoceras hygrometricum]
MKSKNREGHLNDIEGSVTEKVKGKKRKRGRTNSKDDYCIESQGNRAEAVGSKNDGLGENMTIESDSKSVKMHGSTTEGLTDDFSEKVKRKKKKAAEDPTSSKSRKKVSFSGHVEVFPLSDDSKTKEIYDEENLVQGKRFTPEENEIVKEAVYRFIRDHNLGEDGLDMVLNCQRHSKLRGCWKEIGAAIPYRPYTAVYCRAQVLFRRSESRKWTQEEYDMVLQYQELHGNDWKALADELGKHRWHVKDTWRRIKLRNMNKGQWSQKEYQTLFDLVNIDLQQKLSEEKKSKHGMLRDNICWTAISDKLTTRAQPNCCRKWYRQLTSPMVEEGLWADTDDYRMLQMLYRMDAGCMEDVDWDTLLDHRSGDLCRKRWNQMVRHIGKYGTKPFSEQVDVLAQRYCPHLLEAREIWDNKPRVP